MIHENYTWVFGYGSLIWRPDFEFAGRLRGFVKGWQRRFWQGSTDHRGTPGAPGRVVTLTPATGQRCYGIAFAISPQHWPSIERKLDVREQGGYERVDLTFHHEPLEGNDGGGNRRLTVYAYRATEANEHYLGADSLDNMATQIAQSRGPSGSNWEYLERLDNALDQLEVPDQHVRELTQHCMELGCSRPARTTPPSRG